LRLGACAADPAITAEGIAVKIRRIDPAERAIEAHHELSSAATFVLDCPFGVRFAARPSSKLCEIKKGLDAITSQFWQAARS
jgi:hypothetical protein